MPAGPPPITRIFFFSSASGTLSSFSNSKEGFMVQDTRLPNIIPFKQRRQPIHGRISSSRPSIALFTNSGSQRFARPIMQASAFPFAIISSANHGSKRRPTLVTGICTYFLISSESAECVPSLVPGAGMELPRAIVVPPETWSMSTPAFSNCLET